jgi:hypothetical protein
VQLPLVRGFQKHRKKVVLNTGAGQFRSTNRLPYMTLDVLGNMRQQADHGGRQAFAPDFATLRKARRIESANHLFGISKSVVNTGQEIDAASARGRFLGGEHFQLLRSQLAPPEVHEQALRAPGDVPQVESDRPEAMRSGPDLLIRKAIGVSRQVLARLLERIKDWRNQRIDAGDRPAQPRFGLVLHRSRLARCSLTYRHMQQYV